MRPRPGLLLLCALPGLAVTPPLRAWSALGHEVVAEIARERLSAVASQRVTELLAGSGESLAEAANWADRVRSEPAWEWTRPLHYLNVPDGATTIDLARDCPPQGCIVTALERYAAVLADRAAPRGERLDALRFVLHLVGDLHQPMHVSRGSDRGGNDLEATFFGEQTDLHHVWDGLILERRFSGSAARIARRLRPSRRGAEVAAWSRGTPLDWAGETLSLALSHAYVLPDPPRLGRAYYRRNVGVVEQQLRRAGVRLAVMLERALGPDSGGTDVSIRPLPGIPYLHQRARHRARELDHPPELP